MFTQKYRSEISHSTSVSGPGSSPAGKGRRCIVLEAKGETRGRRRCRGRPRGREARPGGPRGPPHHKGRGLGARGQALRARHALSPAQKHSAGSVTELQPAPPQPALPLRSRRGPPPSPGQLAGFQENRSGHMSLLLLHQALWKGLGGGLPPPRRTVGGLDSGSPPGQHRKAHAPLCRTRSLQPPRAGVCLLWLRGGGHGTDAGGHPTVWARPFLHRRECGDGRGRGGRVPRLPGVCRARAEPGAVPSAEGQCGAARARGRA